MPFDWVKYARGQSERLSGATTRQQELEAEVAELKEANKKLMALHYPEEYQALDEENKGLIAEVKRLRGIIFKIQGHVDAFMALDGLTYEEGLQHRPGWVTVNEIDRLLAEVRGGGE